MAPDMLTVASNLARNPDASAIVGRSLVYRAKARELLGDLQSARVDLERAIGPLTSGLHAEHPETLEAKDMLTRLNGRT